MANIKRQAGESAVTREARKPSGLRTVSHRGRHRALGTPGMSSAVQHHADELCEKGQRGELGSRVKGGSTRGQETS